MGSVPKWRTLQVFVEWEGYRGAGEWTRTTDLLITNKLLRRLVVYRLSIDGYRCPAFERRSSAAIWPENASFRLTASRRR